MRLSEFDDSELYGLAHILCITLIDLQRETLVWWFSGDNSKSIFDTMLNMLRIKEDLFLVKRELKRRSLHTHIHNLFKRTEPFYPDKTLISFID